MYATRYTLVQVRVYITRHSSKNPVPEFGWIKSGILRHNVSSEFVFVSINVGQNCFGVILYECDFRTHITHMHMCISMT